MYSIEELIERVSAKAYYQQRSIEQMPDNTPSREINEY